MALADLEAVRGRQVVVESSRVGKQAAKMKLRLKV